MQDRTDFNNALRSLLKSECFGLSTSATPQGYILARTGCPSSSISSSEPMMAKGSNACGIYVNGQLRLKLCHIPATRCCPGWSPRRLPPRRKGSCRRGCRSARYPPLSTTSRQHRPKNKTGRTNPLLESPKLAGCQRICFSNNRNHINTRRKAAHQLNIHLPQAIS